MLKIGDFSMLGRVSVKALRIYDEMGLLKPERVDPMTQYRYYSAVQLGRLRAIRGLLGLGFKLEEIGPVIDGRLAGGSLAEAAERKLAEAEKLRAELEERAGHLRALRAAALGGKPLDAAFPGMDHSGLRWTTEPGRWILAIKKAVPDYSHAGALVAELYAALGRPALAGAFPAGPPSCIYHDGEFRERDPLIEVFFPLSAPVEAPVAREGELGVRYLEEASGLSIDHRGGYDTLGDAYSALAAAMDASGVELAGPPRESWVSGPGEGRSPEEYLTRIFYPCISP